MKREENTLQTGNRQGTENTGDTGRWRNYLWILIVIPVFFAVIAFATSRIISQRLRASSFEHYQLVANNTAETINSWLSSKKEIVLNQRTSLESISRFDRDYVTYFLEEAIAEREDSKEICDLYFIDSNGVLSTANGYYTDYDLRTRNYYLSCLDTREVFYTSPYRDISTGSYIVTLSVSCRDKKGELAGVLAIDIYIDAFLDPVNFTQVPNNSYIFLIDSTFGLASHPYDDYGYVNELPRSISDLDGGIYGPIENEMSSGEYRTVVVKDYDGVKRDMFLSRIPCCNWCAVAAISDDELKSSERLMIGYILVALFISLAVGILWTVFGAKRLMDQLNAAIAEAESANEYKSLFLANMSHEIRTPINAILGMNEIVLRDAREAREAARRGEPAGEEVWDEITVSSGDIMSSGNNLLTIINDILDFSKIEAGKMEITEKEYGLGSVLNDVSNTIYYRAKDKGLEFVVDVDESIPERLYGDEYRLRQVMINLLGNAVKYTPEGNVRLMVDGRMKEQEDGSRVEELTIKVRDTGIGIRKEDIDKLFLKFERVDLKQNSSVEGTGLGLAIVKNLLELMGGSIKVESEYGKGSLFIVHLPQKVISPEPIGNFRERFREKVTSEDKYEELFTAPEALILAVDDTRMNLTVIKGLLKKTQIQIDLAGSGEEAMEFTELRKYDLILMDQRMPDMNGTEAMENIKAMPGGPNRDTCFICLTADAVNGAKERYMEEGFADYLAKPINGLELEKMLLKYLPEEKVRRTAEHAEGAYSGEKRQEVSGEDGKKELGRQETHERTGAVNISNAGRGSLREMLEAAGFDYEMGLRNCMREEDLYREILLEFVTSYEEYSGELAQYYESEDLSSYVVKVHALKSSARTIGEVRLSELARQQEEMAKAGDLQGVRTGYGEMKELYESRVAAIRTMIDQGLLEEG